MNCPKCGKEIDEGSIFCKFCGASLNEDEKIKEEIEVSSNEMSKESNVEKVSEKSNKENVKKDENKSSAGFVIDTGIDLKKDEKNNKKIKENEISKEGEDKSTKKEESNSDDTKANSTEEKKIIINGKEQTIKPRKRHSIITFGIILAIVVVIIAIVLIVISLISTPENLYKNFISGFSNIVDVESKYESANVSANLSISTDIDELKDAFDDLNFEINVQYDNSTEEYIGKINIEKERDSYLNLVAMINLLDKKLYIGEENLYDKLICIDIPEENINEIKIALSEEDNTLSDSNDIKKVAKIVTDTINDNLDRNMFTSQKINVNINGKDKKVKDNMLSFTYDELVSICKNVTESLKNNTEFMSYFEDKDSIEQYLDDLVDSVESMEEYNYEIHIYTSGLFNSVVGGSFVQIDDILEESYVIELLRQSNNEYSIVFDIVSDNDKSRVLNATMTLKNIDKNNANVEVNFDFPEEGNLILALQMSTNYNNGIEAIDVSNSININEITQEDIQQIFSGLITTPFFDELTQLEEGNLAYNIEENNLYSIENYLLTFDDEKISFSIPTTFKELYNGNYIKSYTKETDLGYCDIDIETESYTEEEYLQYLDSKLDYYRESGDYIDISISDPEQMNVNGREYKKVTIKYTYSDGSFSIDYKSDYYYTIINDHCIYSVEVSDTDIIMTQDELNKFLTIEVQ